jgi:hypothetical protein
LRASSMHAVTAMPGPERDRRMHTVYGLDKLEQ